MLFFKFQLSTIASSDSAADSRNFSATTCGRDAFSRGSGQKVIGFSLYGPNVKGEVVQNRVGVCVCDLILTFVQDLEDLIYRVENES